jgi:tRNA (mo5U34)-methyltransferase
MTIDPCLADRPSENKDCQSSHYAAKRFFREGTKMTSLTLDDAKKLVDSVPHWHHTFEIFPGLWTPGNYHPAMLWEKLQLPADLTGMRILDIGASDGFFSRKLREAGAEVVSIDYRDKTDSGFGVMERIYGKPFDYRKMNVYRLDNENVGGFDIVLFLGVLYHLPNMMQALGIVRSVTRGKLYIETYCENEFCPDVSAARYYVEGTLGKDWTNFWAPNRLCVLDMLHDASFDSLRDESWGDRLLVEAAVNSEPERLKKLNIAYGLIG